MAMRENLVLGLEVVLANGEVWNGLRALMKETLATISSTCSWAPRARSVIITGAVLKLWPAPKDVCTAWLAIRDPGAAIELLSEAHAASDDNVGSCELMSRACTDMVLRHIPGTQDPPSGGDRVVSASGMVVGPAARGRRRGHVLSGWSSFWPTSLKPAGCWMR